MDRPHIWNSSQFYCCRYPWNRTRCRTGSSPFSRMSECRKGSTRSSGRFLMSPRKPRTIRVDGSRTCCMTTDSVFRISAGVFLHSRKSSIWSRSMVLHTPGFLPLESAQLFPYSWADILHWWRASALWLQTSTKKQPTSCLLIWDSNKIKS